VAVVVVVGRDALVAGLVVTGVEGLAGRGAAETVVTVCGTTLVSTGTVTVDVVATGEDVAAFNRGVV
jgi:hypothetical protein